jgi:hypothetical protein
MKKNKLKHKITIIILCGLLVSYSCKKRAYRKDTIVSGQILEYGSNAPVKNAKVNLVISGAGSNGFGSSSTEVIEIARTNDNGEYSHTFRAEKGKRYKITSSATSYVSAYLVKDDDYDIKEENLGRKTTINNILVPPAWVKFKIKNVNKTCQTYIVSTTNIFSFVNDINLIGLNVDTIITSKTNGNYSNKYSIGISCNAPNTVKEIIKYTPAWDTTEIIINY